MGKGPYLVRRILLAIPTLIGITMVTFVMTRFAPGDPALARAGDSTTAGLSASDYQQLREYLELDQPLVVQYGRWLGRALRLDFGRCWRGDRPVMEKIGVHLGATMSLAMISLGLALAISIPVGLFCAARAGGWFDRVSGVLLYALFAIPNYVVAIVLIAVVSVKLGWLPASGRRASDYDLLPFWSQVLDLAKHYVLITICFSYPVFVYQTRFVRNNVLEMVASPFVRTARAKGVGEWHVYVRHVFRNTLIGLLTLLGILFPLVVSGSAVLEYVFDWPGIGKLYVDSILARDYPMVMGLSVVTAAMVLLGTLLADLSYGLVDPRVRYD
ncbi:MAG: ABC transporter permease [Phycisphaerae bacterium]|nr:ABC transporter permease [Phycisphaerae bacterium]